MKSPAEELWFAVMTEIQRQKGMLNAAEGLDSVSLVVRFNRGKATRVILRTESQGPITNPPH